MRQDKLEFEGDSLYKARRARRDENWYQRTAKSVQESLHLRLPNVLIGTMRGCSRDSAPLLHLQFHPIVLTLQL